MKIKSNAHKESIFAKILKLIKADGLWFLISVMIAGFGIIIAVYTTNLGVGIGLGVLAGLMFMILKDGSMDEYWGMPAILTLIILLFSSVNTSFNEREIKVNLKNITLSESNEKMIIYFTDMKKSMAVIDMADNSTDFYTIKSSLNNDLNITVEIIEKETKDLYDMAMGSSHYRYKLNFKVYHPSLGKEHETNYEDLLSTTYTKNETYIFEKAQF